MDEEKKVENKGFYDSPADIFFECKDLVRYVYYILLFFTNEEEEQFMKNNGTFERVKTVNAFRQVKKNNHTFIPFNEHFRNLRELGIIHTPPKFDVDDESKKKFYLDAIHKEWASELVIEYEKSILIEGPAGTGKTHFAEEIISQILKEDPNRIVLNTSTTGCSARLLQNGSTIDSALGFGRRNYINVKDPENYKDPVSYGYYTAKILKKEFPWKAERIQSAYAIRIDEVSMLSSTDFTYFSTIVSAICGVFHKPFGGKLLILTGDLFQIPPIPTKYGISRDKIVPGTDEFFIDSHIFKKSGMHIISLLFSYRQKEDPVYTNILDRMRVGANNGSDIAILSQRKYKSEEEKSMLMNDTSIVKIFPRNDRVDRSNNDSLRSIDAPEESFPVLYDIFCQVDEKRAEDHAKSLGLETLVLKRNCRIMIIHNQNVDKGVVNGRTGTYLKSRSSYLKVLLDGDETTTLVKRKEYSQFNSEGNPLFKVSQYPIKLGYAITVNKSQGASLGKVIADTDVFGEGSFYVLCSRVSKLENIHFLNFYPEKIRANKKLLEKFVYSSPSKRPSPSQPCSERVKETFEKKNVVDDVIPDDEFKKKWVDFREKVRVEVNNGVKKREGNGMEIEKISTTTTQQPCIHTPSRDVNCNTPPLMRKKIKIEDIIDVDTIEIDDLD